MVRCVNIYLPCITGNPTMRRPPLHATKSKECLFRRVVRLIQDANKDLKRVLLILDDMFTKGIVNTLHNQITVAINCEA